MANETHFPVVIIGGGPAGIATAIQLKRFDIEPVIFEPARLGGLLWNANKVENYPGIKRGIRGPELCEQLVRHMESFNIEIIRERITEMEFHTKRGVFILKSLNASYTADIAVAASGTRAKNETWDQLVSNEKQLKKHIKFEIANLLEIKDSSLIIVGAGDAAFDYALNLTREPSNQAVIVHRGNEIKALPLLHRAINEHKNITFHQGYTLNEIKKGENKPLKTVFISTEGKTLTLEANYLIGALGRVPQKDFFTARLLAEEEKLIANNRLYLTGDIKNGHYRQTAIATGNGIETAMKIAASGGRVAPAPSCTARLSTVLLHETQTIGSSSMLVRRPGGSS